MRWKAYNDDRSVDTGLGGGYSGRATGCSLLVRRKLGPSGRVQGAHPMQNPGILELDGLRTEASSRRGEFSVPAHLVRLTMTALRTVIGKIPESLPTDGTRELGAAAGWRSQAFNFFQPVLGRRPTRVETLKARPRMVPCLRTTASLDVHGIDFRFVTTEV